MLRSRMCASIAAHAAPPSSSCDSSVWCTSYTSGYANPLPLAIDDIIAGASCTPHMFQHMDGHCRMVPHS
eukprot:COSAG01_NODE_2500_length_7559_cov_21.958847_4_plen_70_part_00